MNKVICDSFFAGVTQMGTLFPSVDISEYLENINIGTTDTSPSAAWADVEKSFEEVGLCIRESIDVFRR
jgi:hypothetical protein